LGVGIEYNNKMNLRNFYKQFENTTNEDRFLVFNETPLPSSLFVIFQQLTVVRNQKKYFEEREAHLLSIAEKQFNQLEKKENVK